MDDSDSWASTNPNKPFERKEQEAKRQEKSGVLKEKKSEGVEEKKDNLFVMSNVFFFFHVGSWNLSKALDKDREYENLVIADVKRTIGLLKQWGVKLIW